MFAMSLATMAAAQAAAPAGSVEVPDGAPILGSQDVAAASSAGARPPQEGATTSLQVREERIQGRLASAQVSVGGRSYLIVDPAVGRYDRQADNAGRRVTPVLWQLLRF